MPTARMNNTVPLVDDQGDGTHVPLVKLSTAAAGTGGTSSVTAAPTVSTTAYTAGQVVGGLLTFTAALNASVLSGVVQSVQVNSKSAQAATLKLALFSSNPSASSFPDRGTAVINTADVDKLIGIFALVGPLSSLGTHTSWTLSSIGRALAAPGVNLFGVLITDAAMTLPTISDISINLSVLKD